MKELNTAISAIHRPKLLIRAARLGVGEYRRDRDLRRVLRLSTLPTVERAVARLIDEESSLEEGRASGSASYSAVRHVEVMIALMAEARLLPRAHAA